MNLKRIYLFAAYSLIVGAFNSAHADGFPAEVTDLPPQTTPKKVQLKNTRPKFEEPTRDSLALDPSIAIKATPPKSVDLPGVLKTDGQSLSALDPTAARIISMNNGGSQTVYLSNSEPNRIQLPFNDPYIVGTDEIVINKRSSTNNVYISFSNQNAKAVQVFIESPDGGAVLGLQLVPKSIHSQTIIVQDDTVSTKKPKSRRTGGESDYLDDVQELMEIVASNRIPDGYSVIQLEFAPILMDGVVVTPGRRLSSRDSDIFVYTISNPTDKNVTITEKQFDGEFVSAVSIFPKPLMRPGEQTSVIVLSDKNEGK